MKLIETKSSMTCLKEMPGLFDAKFTHEIKQTVGSLNYTGPFIPTAVWHQVLSFFAWSYETTKSETQVRLFVNAEQRTWAAWAFPQKASTGMTAQEMETEDASKQRAQFPESQGWIYFGTVHHHCSTGAFQSGTDKQNEQNQLGLHITVGNINQGYHTLHARFYVSQECFEPDMSLFWDIGEEVRKLIPPSVWSEAARHQMCQHQRVEFPEVWKQNLIVIKHEVTRFEPSTAGFFGPGAKLPAAYQATGVTKALYVRLTEATLELVNELGGYRAAGELLARLEQCAEIMSLMDILDTYRLSFGDLYRDFPPETIWDHKDQELELMEANAQAAEDGNKLSKVLLEENGLGWPYGLE